MVHLIEPTHNERFTSLLNQFYSAMQTERAITLAIILRSSMNLIGVVNLRLPENETPHLGYWLGAAYWGKGYCTEAVLEMLRYGFSRLGLQQINARCYDNNAASEKVMRRCGMRKEPESPVTEEINGRRVRLVNYSITRNELM
ncbi:GNAT family N-acetyltransferase [Brenneria corticis]|uniref:N-acetyltransferase domain-containing protein n=1 Tax=Brenneria corticis TaxID=2173106 RepID=A0A2U1UCV1_9GAMM|nr:GNAT family N-acetyltransferase [Brenneria sp. CFCC 11842]PWC19506.1 hypothetical protein DDT56_00565 [Brenneria sp. CFCC 11842]